MWLHGYEILPRARYTLYIRGDRAGNRMLGTSRAVDKMDKGGVDMFLGGRVG